MKKNDMDITDACEFCEHCSTLAGEQTVLCRYRGIVSCNYKCRKFTYDPLKRRPMSPPQPLIPDIDDLIL